MASKPSSHFHFEEIELNNVEIMHDGMPYPKGTIVHGSVFGAAVNDHVAIGSVRLTSRPATIHSGALDLPEGEAEAVAKMKQALVQAEGALAKAEATATSLKDDLELHKSELETAHKANAELKNEVLMLREQYAQLLQQTRGVN